MGDRILFQVHRKANPELHHQREVGPVVYGHWSGDAGPAICEALQKRMKGREGDVSYTTARLVQELLGDDEGNLGAGVWNRRKLLTAKDTHGDAGVVLIECTAAGLRFDCLGGYLRASEDRISVLGE